MTDPNREIDHEYTDEIVCPWCGHRHQDSWEWFADSPNEDTEGECGSCGKSFFVSEHRDITYSTKRIEP